MGTKKKEGKQVSIRLPKDEHDKLIELQTRLGHDATTIGRWALTQYYRLVSTHGWVVTSLGDPIIPPPVTPPPETPAEAPQDAPHLARRLSPR